MVRKNLQKNYKTSIELVIISNQATTPITVWVD